MRVDPKFFNSKVARRVFLLFIICALLPIWTLAVLSFSQISKQLERQSQRRLHQSCKALGISIFERLTFLEQQLENVSYSLRGASAFPMQSFPTMPNEGLKKGFEGLALLTDSRRLQLIFGNIQNLSERSAEEKRHLKSGKSLLLTPLAKGDRSGIYMMRLVNAKHPEWGILIGKINPLYLWGLNEYNTLPGMTDLSVLDQTNNVIYSTLRFDASFFQRLLSEVNRSSVYHFEWETEDEAYLVSFWSLPLKFHFFHSRWIMVLTGSKDYILAPVAQFKKIFPPVVLLALLVILFLSIFQIRKTMLPLAKLKDATRRISMRDFGCMLELKSGDEFEELAASFNTMAKNLEKQFSTLAAISEIDRAILSTLDIDRIVDTVLLRLPAFSHSDCVSLTVFDRDSTERAWNYIQNGRSKDGKIAEKTTLRPEEVQTLLEGPPIQLKDADSANAQYLKRLKAKGLKFFQLIPLLSRHRVLGIITLAYLRPPPHNQEDQMQIRQLTNQVAVALSNSQLTESLKETEMALKKSNVKLEQRVKERTKDLTNAIEHLKREIANRKRVEVELKGAKQTAEIANRSKSEFLANMSHELRTPLNAVIGFNELLVDKHLGDLNEIQEEYLNDMLESSRHLLSLINDILDLSKVEAGKLEMSLSEFNLKELLSGSLVMVKEKAMKHGIQMGVNIDSAPETVVADERKLKQIMYNLLSNALKFTPDGGSVNLSAQQLMFRDGYVTSENGEKIEIPSFGGSRHSVNGAFVLVSVVDTGIGIKQEDQLRIFDPFEQVENSASKKHQGTGLGLSLTHRLVELHKGKIWVESEGDGQGATFRFFIPIRVEKLSGKNYP